MGIIREEKDFRLTYYSQLIVLSLQLYRTAGPTSLVIATPADDETAYRQYTGIVATYACALYRLDPQHLLWVERTPGLDPQGDTFALVEFGRSIMQAGARAGVVLHTPARAPLSYDRLRLLQRRLEEEEGR